MKKNVIFNSIVLKLSIAAMISVIIAVVIVSMISARISKDILSRDAIKSMEEAVNRNKERLTNSMELVRQDAFFISQSEEIQELLRTGESDTGDVEAGVYEVNLRKKMETSFSILIKVKGYQQIRFIEFDNNGREIIRVDKNDNELLDPVVTGVDDLQEKGDSVYVQEGRLLKNNQMYISSINLNREFGFIEQPWTPTQRFVAPVFKRGVNESVQTDGDQVLLGRSIKYLNEVLSMSILMAVETNEKSWIDKYFLYESELSQDLQHAFSFVPQSGAELITEIIELSHQLDDKNSAILALLSNSENERAEAFLSDYDYLSVLNLYKSKSEDLYDLLKTPLQKG